MDPLTTSERDVLTQWASTVNVELLDMLEFEAWGGEEGVRCDPGPVKGVPGELELDMGRIATISYTSGTTGMSECYEQKLTARQPQGSCLDKLQLYYCHRLERSRSYRQLHQR